MQNYNKGLTRRLMIVNGDPQPEVSIIVPVRNEEACLKVCLESLLTQEDVLCEIFVADDSSSDNTRALAQTCSGVKVLAADPLPTGWSGKANACLTAAKQARGNWLLFTDADTYHAPGALASALREAQEFGVSMLSYSPKQEAVTSLEKAVLPLIFAELATANNTEAINNHASPLAAANGQYILIKREAYWAIGGHAAVATEIVEDVALAKVLKRSGRRLRFRYEGSQVRTRMYRDSRQLIEGWTKNLYQLFPSAIGLGLLRLLEFVAIFSVAVFGLAAALRGSTFAAAIATTALLILYFNFLRRVQKAHFDIISTAFSFRGLPFLSFLLWRSFIKYRISHAVTWKGRSYSVLYDIPHPLLDDKHVVAKTTSAKV